MDDFEGVGVVGDMEVCYFQVSCSLFVCCGDLLTDFCRWIGPTGGGFKTGGYIDVGDLKKMRISIDFVDAGDDGGVVVV